METSTGVEGIQEIGFGEDSFLCFEVSAEEKSAEESMEMDQVGLAEITDSNIKSDLVSVTKITPLLLNSEPVAVEETALSPTGVSHEIAVETPLRKRKRTTDIEDLNTAAKRIGDIQTSQSIAVSDIATALNRLAAAHEELSTLQKTVIENAETQKNQSQILVLLSQILANM